MEAEDYIGRLLGRVESRVCLVLNPKVGGEVVPNPWVHREMNKDDDGVDDKPKVHGRGRKKKARRRKTKEWEYEGA